MTPAQTSLYWREWAACRAALLALGRDASDAARRHLQAEALRGRVKSSKSLTNAEFSAVLGKFRAFSKPDDLGAQMHAQEEQDPATTRGRYLDRIHAGLILLKPDHDFADPKFAGLNRGTYVNALAQKMYGAGVAELDLDQLRKLAGLIETRAESRRQRDQAAALRHAVAAGEASDGNPF